MTLLKNPKASLRSCGQAALSYLAVAYDLFRFRLPILEQNEPAVFACGQVPLPKFICACVDNLYHLFGGKREALMPKSIAVHIKHYQHAHNLLAGFDMLASFLANLGQAATDAISLIPVVGPGLASGALLGKLVELGGEGVFSAAKHRVVKRMTELGAPISLATYDYVIYLDIGTTAFGFAPCIGTAVEFFADFFCSYKQIQMVNAAVRQLAAENEALVCQAPATQGALH